jgi:PadR family transcriptional regulator, regulatory protein AphA
LQVIRLTHTSYIVLGFVEAMGQATPYELKHAAGASVGNFWSIPHAQFYTEPERLAGAGYLTEKQEEGGRRRKHYALTARGRKALDAWRAEPTSEFVELRDPGLLQVFFGADPVVVAEAQLAGHRRKLAEYEALAELDMVPGQRRALEAGLAHERLFIRYWETLAAGKAFSP